MATGVDLIKPFWTKFTCKLDCFIIIIVFSQCSEKLQLTKRASKCSQKSFMRLTTGAMLDPHSRVGSQLYPQIFNQAGKDFQRQTLKLIFKVRKLRTKSFIRLGTEDKKTFFCHSPTYSYNDYSSNAGMHVFNFFQSADNQSIERRILNTNAGKQLS